MPVWIKAKTKCYYINTGNGLCPNYGDVVIGRASIKRGTKADACKNGKKAANDHAPRYCQAKHCQPCKYE